jgi:hypothetical protein
MKQYQQSHPHLFEQIGEVLKTNSNFEHRLSIMGKIFQLLIIGGILFFLSILWEPSSDKTSEEIANLLFIGVVLVYALVKTIKKLLYYYEYAYVGTEGFLTLYMRKKPPSKISKYQLIRFVDVETMELYSETSCTPKHPPIKLKLYDKEVHHLATITTQYHYLWQDVEEIISKRLFERLKDKTVFFQELGSMHIDVQYEEDKENKDGIYFDSKNITLVERSNAYLLNSQTCEDIHTKEEILHIFLTKHNREVKLSLSFFINRKLLLELIAYRLNLSKEKLLLEYITNPAELFDCP